MQVGMNGKGLLKRRRCLMYRLGLQLISNDHQLLQALDRVGGLRHQTVLLCGYFKSRRSALGGGPHKVQLTAHTQHQKTHAHVGYCRGGPLRRTTGVTVIFSHLLLLHVVSFLLC